jgi:putative phage-type endonuclease
MGPRLRIVDVVQGSPEWLAWRLGKMMASNTAAILGKCPYSTPYEKWAEFTGRKPAFEGNEATERGKQMEDPARAAYEMHCGFIEAKPVCVLHPTLDFIGASLDGLDFETMIPVEMKYASERSHQLALEGQVPEHYFYQVQHQLMCVPDAPYAHYWSYRSEKPALVEVKHDSRLQAIIEDGLTAFWNLVKADVPPPLTERDAKIIDEPGVISACQRLLDLKDRSDNKSKEQSDELKRLILELGGHNKVRCGKVLVSKTISAAGKESFRLTVAKDKETA